MSLFACVEHSSVKSVKPKSTSVTANATTHSPMTSTMAGNLTTTHETTVTTTARHNSTTANITVTTSVPGNITSVTSAFTGNGTTGTLEPTTGEQNSCYTFLLQLQSKGIFGHEHQTYGFMPAIATGCDS